MLRITIKLDIDFTKKIDIFIDTITSYEKCNFFDIISVNFYQFT